MYANVQIEYGGATRQVTLPQSAITYNPYGNTVYVIQKSTSSNAATPDDKSAAVFTAQQRFVKLGETRGDQVAVLDGVKPGDEIVTAGQLKLHNGSAVTVNNEVTPTNQPSPTPPNE
jgi:membrane fusion protein (multidrug efflux system)